MTALPAPFTPGEARFWRLDTMNHAATWNRGEGSFRKGGRWNSPGLRVIYAALDASTAILEVAVHKTFRALDTIPHTLTSARIVNTADAHVVTPDDLPNPNWLHPGMVSAGQQAHGDALLRDHSFILVPSVVSRHNWNVVFLASNAVFYEDARQERFALDTRLNASPFVP